VSRKQKTRRYAGFLFIRLERLTDFGDDAGEAFGIVFREFGEHFGVERDALFVGGADKLGVRKLFVQRAQPRVDADVPQPAEVVLFVAAVGKGVLARVEDGLLGGALLGRARVAVALGHRKDILAALVRCYSSFYTCHKILLFRRVADVALQDLRGHGARRNNLAAVVGHLAGAPFLGVKVVLARLARDNLAAAGDLEAFGERFVRLHRIYCLVVLVVLSLSSTVASPLGLLAIGSASL